MNPSKVRDPVQAECPPFRSLIMQMGATVMGVVGLIFGIIGLQSTYTKRGRADIGIILCAVSIIIAIVMWTIVFSGGLGR